VRAVLFDGQSVQVVPDAPEPAPGPGDALIRPTLVAVGSSDLEVARGRTAFRGVMGHLFVGVVEHIEPGGTDRSHLLKKRVVGSINIVPADSPLARKGLGNHAPDRQVLGLHSYDGCFAERFTLPGANLVAVPDEIGDDQAVLTVLLAEAVHASRITRIEGKPFVTILGDGLVALLCAQVMTKMNASVRLLGENPARFGLCEKWGVKHRAITEAGLRQDQDIVIECTGTAAGLERAMGMVRPRGRIVLKHESVPTPGSIGAGTGPDLTPIIMNELEVVGARCGSPGEALALQSHQPIDLISLIGRRFRLADAPEALRLAAEPGALCVVMEP
jgi:threonine dehydrogenase-like Zn-dependent dehydrogenase